jgi:hypothetical protein
LIARFGSSSPRDAHQHALPVIIRHAAMPPDALGIRRDRHKPSDQTTLDQVATFARQAYELVLVLDAFDG